MKAKFKIGMLLSYSNNEGENVFAEIKAVINHHDHADYLMDNGEHVAEGNVHSAFAPVAVKKSAPKKRGPRKAKGEAAPVEEPAV